MLPWFPYFLRCMGITWALILWVTATFRCAAESWYRHDTQWSKLSLNKQAGMNDLFFSLIFVIISHWQVDVLGCWISGDCCWLTVTIETKTSLSIMHNLGEELWKYNGEFCHYGCILRIFYFTFVFFVFDAFLTCFIIPLYLHLILWNLFKINDSWESGTWKLFPWKNT